MSNDHPSVQPNFAGAVRAEMDKRGVSLQWLASKAEILPATLRTWMLRGRFPMAGAVRISTALGWAYASAEQLQRAFTAEVWARSRGGRAEVGLQLLDRFGAHDRKRRDAARGVERMNADLADLYDAMGSGDMFVFLADTVAPAEFERFQGDRLRQAIARAVLRGGAFLYLRPDQSLLDHYAGVWQLDRVPRRVTDFDDEVERFRGDIASVIATLADAPTGASLGRMLRKRIVQYSVSRCLYWAPGFSLGMFLTRRPGTAEPVQRMTVRVPGGYGGVWYLPEYPLFAYRFTQCARVALEEQGERLRARTRGSKSSRAVDTLRDDVEAFVLLWHLVVGSSPPPPVQSAG